MYDSGSQLTEYLMDSKIPQYLGNHSHLFQIDQELDSIYSSYQINILIRNQELTFEGAIQSILSLLASALPYGSRDAPTSEFSICPLSNV